MGFVWVDDKEDDDKFKAHITTITKGLSDTKDGLLADMAKLKAKLKEYDGIDVEIAKRAVVELEELKRKAQSGETDSDKQLRILKEQHEELKKTVSNLMETEKKLRVDESVNKALITNNVKPELMSAAAMIIKNDVVIIEEGGKKIAKIGDKSIDDFVAGWVETTVGKNFVLARANSGGDAGGGGDQQTEGDQEKYFDVKSKAYNVTKQIILKKTNPILYNKLLKKFNK